MKRPENLAALNKIAFVMDKYGTKAHYPQFKQDETFFPTVGKNKRYCSNNGTFAWVDENGTEYVCRYFRELPALLSADGYSEEGLFVPFSNGDYPVYRKGDWDNLIALVDSWNWEDMLTDIREICTAKGAGDLPSDIVSRLRIIPRSGLRCTHWAYDKPQMEYPLITYAFCLDSERRKALGTYNQNNGQLVIHANNGVTYVSSWFEGLTAALSAAGYQQNSSLWVPFSNGEVVA